MNTAGCPPGWATDDFLVFDPSIGQCSVSISGFVAISSINLIMSLVTICAQTYLWCRRQTIRQKNSIAASRTSWCRRFVARDLPIILILQVSKFLMLILFVGLSASNVINRFNGSPLFLFSVYLTFTFIIDILYLYKFVSLGQRIIGPNKGKLTSSSEAKLDSLDAFGNVVMLVAWATVLILTFGTTTLALVFPNKVNDSIKTDLAHSPNGKSELKVAARKLREQQITVGFMGFLLFLIPILVATTAIPPYFYVWFCLGILANFMEFLVSASHLRAIVMRKPKLVDGASSGEKNNLQVISPMPPSGEDMVK